MGQGYVVIGRNADGKLVVEESAFDVLDDCSFIWDVTHSEKPSRLVLEVIVIIDRDPPIEEPPLRKELIPSKSVPGDWDSMAPSFVSRDSVPGENSSKQTQKFDVLHSPSYLHRVTDTRILEYFSKAKALSESEPTEKDIQHLMELGAALLDSHPDDLHVRTLYVDALMRRGDFAALSARLSEWEQQYQTAGGLFYPMFLKFKSAVESHEKSALGTNAFDWLKANESNLMSRNTFLEIKRFSDFLHPISQVLYYMPIPRLFSSQTASKVYRVEATFLMIEGRREEALDLMDASYHLGLIMGWSNELIGTLVGTAMRGIVNDPLNTFALNCCESEEEIQRLWTTLELMNEKIGDRDVREIESLLIGGLEALPISSQPQILTRLRVADAEFQLTRTAVAAKHRLLKKHSFPLTEKEFSPLLPDGLPKDPFGKGVIRFLRQAGDFICYSVGPDEKDDVARVEYDPTNGTLSGGDITLRVPAHRRYPFPRAGVRAKTPDDLRRQFPNGLPKDPFRDRGTSELGVAFHEGSVFVYSNGPNHYDDWQNMRGDPKQFLLYDPTNGTTSHGDLVLEIPR